MTGGIHKEATVEEIDDWFSSTLQEDRILCLADTIEEWKEEDLSRLTLAKRLSPKEIVELLQAEAVVGVELWGESVIHHLAIYNPSTLLSLLDRVTPQHLLSLFRLEDFLGLNVLGYALRCNRLPIPAYVVEHLGVDELYNLLRARVYATEEIQLHMAVGLNGFISEVLSLLEDEARVHHLLSIEDKLGRSVLSYSIYRGSEKSFQSIIRCYTGKQAELLELAAIPDNEGNTSFHHAAGQETSNYLTDLIKATCSLETRGELANVLSMRNYSDGKKELGEEVEECNSDNEFIYDWAFDSLTDNRYLLFDFPSILIMYNTANRDEADKEATSLETCFADFGFKANAKSSFTKKELFKAIKDHLSKESSRNGQIVALMSHGLEGYINDRDGTPIPLNDIERRMCPDSHRDTPKLLILQCCQARKSTDASSDAGGGNSRSDNSYSPTNADFCALMSTGAGTVSERNTFIPFLAVAIQDADVNTDISTTMKAVKRQFPVNIKEQAPYCLDGLKFDFSIKSILPVYLSIARKTKPETAEGRQQDPTSLSESDADGEHQLEPAPSSSEPDADGEHQLEPAPSSSESDADGEHQLEPAPSSSESDADGEHQMETASSSSESDAAGEHQLEPAPSSSESNVDRKHQLEPTPSSSESDADGEHQMEPAPSSSESNVDRKHQLEPASSSSEPDADREHQLEPAPSSSESDADGDHQMEPASSSSTSNANHGTKRQREDEGKGAKRKKVTAASSIADARADPVGVE